MKNYELWLSEFLVAVFVSLMIRIKEKIMKIKGNNHIKMGVLTLIKWSPSMYLPKNNKIKMATAHWEAKPANLDQTILLLVVGIFFNL